MLASRSHTDKGSALAVCYRYALLLMHTLACFFQTGATTITISRYTQSTNITYIVVHKRYLYVRTCYKWYNRSSLALTNSSRLLFR